MSKQKMPEWLRMSKSYRLLIEAAEAAFNGSCDCTCCGLVREWAKTAPPPKGPGLPGVKDRGRKR